MQGERMTFLKKNNSSVVLVGFGILSLMSSLALHSSDKQSAGRHTQFQNIPLHATSSMGHTEFAWTLVAIQSLAATVNAWNAHDSEAIDASEKARNIAKFEESLEILPALAEASLGMREVFTFPASFLAFELNKIDRAIEIARAGANDIRIEADLALSIAFLTHIFKGDLIRAADDYQRVAMHFPTATWLQDTIRMLRQGIDPSTRAGKDKTILCKMLANAFPLAKKKLVQRKLCSLQQIGEGMNNE